MPVNHFIFDGSFIGQQNGIGRDSEYILENLEGEVEILRYRGQPKSMILENHKVLVSKFTRRQAQLISTFLGSRISHKASAEFSFLPQITSELIYRENTNKIIRCHDLFPITNPIWFTAKSRIRFSHALKKVQKRDLFLCNSQYTSNQIREVLGWDDISCVVFHPPRRHLEEKKCGMCDACCERSPRGSFILMVGTIEPRKNYKMAIRGFLDSELIPKMIIVGNRGWKRRSSFGLSTSSRILLYEKVCDGALRELYKTCKAFLSASIDEGFNLPLQEAREHGARCIVSDTPVHRELHPDMRNFFDPRDSVAITEFINDFQKWNTPPFKSSTDIPSLMTAIHPFLSTTGKLRS